MAASPHRTITSPPLYLSGWQKVAANNQNCVAFWSGLCNFSQKNRAASLQSKPESPSNLDNRDYSKGHPYHLATPCSRIRRRGSGGRGNRCVLNSERLARFHAIWNLGLNLRLGYVTRSLIGRRTCTAQKQNKMTGRKERRCQKKRGRFGGELVATQPVSNCFKLTCRKPCQTADARKIRNPCR